MKAASAKDPGDARTEPTDAVRPRPEGPAPPGEAEGRFRQLFEHSNEAILLLDPAADRILEANDRASQLLGYQRRELHGLPISTIHPDDLERVRAFAERVLEEGHGWTDELACVTKDGEIVDAEVSASLIPLNGRRLVGATVRDVRDRKRMEASLRSHSEKLERLVAKRTERLRRSEERARLLLEINNAVLRNLAREPLFDAVAEALSRVFPFDRATLCMHRPERGTFLVHALAGSSERVQVLPLGAEIPEEGSRIGQVFSTGRPVAIDDLQAVEAELFEDRLAEVGIRSVMVVPLHGKDRRLGTLALGSTSPGIYRPEDLDFLTDVAGQVALAVERMLAFEEITDLKEELERRAAALHASRGDYRALLEITNAIIGGTERDELFDAIEGVLAEFVPCDRAALVINQPGEDHLEVYALAGDLAARGRELGTLVPRSGSLCGRILETREPAYVPDLSEGDTDVWERTLEETGIRGWAGVPLVAAEEPLAVLAVGTREPDSLTARDLEFLARVGAQVALALEKMLAFEEIRELKSSLEQENIYLQEEIKTEHNFEELVGESDALLEVLRSAETVAPTDASVLLCGETGTGKELLARAIHSLSPRAAKPLVKVNCAALPSGLIESELFGHEKGAFTGALARKIGRFELADGGTIFLDEVADLPAELQGKLLRVLQEGEFERVGGTETLRVDVRVLAATNRDLDEAVAEERFRADLFYRLSVFPIEVPPLRERRGDIPLLVNYFVMRFARRQGKEIDAVPAEAMARLAAYSWPGNVRELRNVIERAVILTRGSRLELGDWFGAETGEAAGSDAPLTLEELQRRHIVTVLETVAWKVSGEGGAAELLGLKPTTLEYRMKKLGIERPR